MQRRQALGAMLGGITLGALCPGVSSAALPIPLRLGAMPIDTAGEAFYALDQGFFAAAGLDVALTVLSNGAAIAAATSSGALDVGFGSPSPVMLAHVNGLPVLFIAPAAVYAGKPNSVLVVAKDAPYRSAADLSGRTIAVAGLHDLTQYVLEQWIDRSGGTAAAVGFVEVPSAQMGEALATGRVAAAVLIEPFTTELRGSTRIFGNFNAAIGNRFLVAGWFAMAPWIEKNPDTVRRFGVAIRQAAQWANSHPKESAAILVRYSKIDPSVLARLGRAHYEDAASVDPQLLQPVIDTMVKYGNVKPIAATDLIWAPR